MRSIYRASIACLAGSWLAAAVLTCSLPAKAAAQEAPTTPVAPAAPTEPEAPTALPQPAEATAPPATPAAPEDPSPSVTETASTQSVPVERMPGSAFWPEPYLRGIYGGSLWLSDFHGLQWPNYQKTGIGVSGDVWVDTAYEKIDRDDTNKTKERSRIQQGRAVLRFTPTYTAGNFFVQGQAELVANKDQSLSQPDVADTDDLWIRVGYWNKVDLKVGRFQGWEVYHLGMGLDLNTFERRGATDPNNAPPDIYGVTRGWDRPPGVGNTALHWYATDFLRFEALSQFGSEQARNSFGGRGVGILDFGWVKFKAGIEYKKLTQVNPNLEESTDPRGAGFGIQFVINPIAEFGFSAARELLDRIDERGNTDLAGSYTTNSFGGFANVRPFAFSGGALEDIMVGFGIDQTGKTNLFENSTTARTGFSRHVQAFGALQYIVAKQLWVKAVFAYANARLEPSSGNNPFYSNKMTSIRLRLQYLF